MRFLSGLKNHEVVANQAPGSVELMYRPSEQVFGVVAHELVRKGWAVYPQDIERRPGVVDGKGISWQQEHKLGERLPTQEALRAWTQQCATLNAACVMGAGSGGTIAIDIDIVDPEMAEKVMAIAEEMLGQSPLIRSGRAPKIALIYRAAPGEKIMSISRKFAEQNEAGETVAGENAIEILSSGKSITFWGVHHRTGNYFRWLRKTPLHVGPEELPEVTQEQIAELFEALQSRVAPFHRASFFATADDIVWDESSGVKIPTLRLNGGSDWVENADGKVIDGREAYLTRLVLRIMQANPGIPDPQAISLISDQFRAHAELSGRWTHSHLISEIQAKVRSTRNNINSGKIKPSYAAARSRRSDVPAVGAKPGAVAQDTETLVGFKDISLPFTKGELRARGLGFLPAGDLNARKKFKGRVVKDAGPPVILTDAQRRSQIADVQVGLKNALDEFFEDVFLANCGKSPEHVRVHVIKAPTGAGKTSQTLRYIGEKLREHHERAAMPRIEGLRAEDGVLIQPAHGLDLSYVDERGVTKYGTMPIVFLLPTYSNIEEVRVRAQILNLDPSLSDEELKLAALELGIVDEASLASRLQDLKRDALNAGLRSMVYRGKVAAGCQMAEKVKIAMEAGVSTSAFCSTVVRPKDAEPETVYCPHYEGCPAIMQRHLIQQHDLVFTPHPFMHLQIPEELKHVRAVIADERIHHLFVHTTEFPVSALTLPRKKVRLLKREREAGITEEEVAMNRAEAVEIVTNAFLTNQCPAAALFNYRESADEGGSAVGFRLVHDCLRVCSSAIQRDVSLHPLMSEAEVRQLCSTPTGRYLREEHRFWSIIRDRMEALQRYEDFQVARASYETRLAEPDVLADPVKRRFLTDQIARLDEMNPPPRGAKEMRIQCVQDFGTKVGDVVISVRISWRSVPNWSEVPLLLLDASAAPEIISKIWGGAEVRTHDISGPLNMRVVGVVNRTFSNASLAFTDGDSETQKWLKAQGLVKVRRALTKISAWYGHSRVVAGSSILLRRLMNKDWRGPDNVDWCHYGAMRGLDFAKHHSAAFSIGRMELPIRTIDGLAAALSYDDEEPELPFDVDGTGLVEGKANQPLLMPSYMQNLRLRSGEVVAIPTPQHPRRWGRLIQRQYREEELLQFVGRLRPVYREGEPPVWFALSTVIPEELVIDDLIHIDDLVSMARGHVWDAMRRCDGVMHPTLMHKQCPEFFASEAQVVDHLRLEGFTPKTPDDRRAMGMTMCEVRHSSGKVSYGWVYGYLPDPVRVLSDALVKQGVSFVSVKVVRPSIPATIAHGRHPDGIEVELGDLEHRAERERLNSEETAIDVFTKGLPRRFCSSVGPYTTHPVAMAASATGSLRDMVITYPEAEAFRTMEAFYKEAFEERKAIAIALGGETYEQLANHTADADTDYNLST